MARDSALWISVPSLRGKALRSFWRRPADKPAAAATSSGGTAAVSALAALPFLSYFEGFQFKEPLWLLALVPVALLAAWRWWRSRRAPAPPAFAAPSSWAKAPRSWRQRLSRLAAPLYALALTLGIAAVAGPGWGPPAAEFIRPPREALTGEQSVDTAVVLDISGSMEGKKIAEARRAASAFIDRQRGTPNRVAVLVFDTQSRLAINLTRDVDALKAATAAIRVEGGGTDLQEGLRGALTHFLEMAILDVDPRAYPGILEVRRALQREGLEEALRLASKDSGLLEAVQARGRDRVVVFLTDGIAASPKDAVDEAHLLGVRIFSVGVGDDIDESSLNLMADGTGGISFHVSDPAMLTRIFLDIDRLKNRTPVARQLPEGSAPALRDREVAAAAWAVLALALLLQFAPARPRLTGKSAALVVFLGLLAGGGMEGSAQAQEPPPVPRASSGFGPRDLLPYKRIPEIEEGNRLLKEGDAPSALERYREAARLHPDSPEALLNQGMAERKLGMTKEAESSLKRAAQLAGDQERPELYAAARHQLGHLEKERGRVPEALEHFREASRVRAQPGSASSELEDIRGKSRRNYESLLRSDAANGKQGGGSGKGDGQGQGKGKGRPSPGGQKGGSGGQGEGSPDKGEPQDGKGKEPGQDGKGGETKERSDQPGGSGDSQGRRRDEDFREGLDRLRRSLGGDRQRDRWSDQPRRGWAWALGGLFAALPAGLERLFAGDGVSLVWTHPLFLWLTALVVPLAALWAAWAAWKRLKAWRWFSLRPKESILRKLPASLRRALLPLAALGLLGIAAAGPAVQSQREGLTFGGKDIVFLQDASWSVMWAEDGRLDAAVGGLERFSYWINSENAGDRAVIIPFAGRAEPGALSRDHRNLTFQLHHLGEAARTLREGSDISNAYAHAVDAFEHAQDIGHRGKVIVLLSDGGDSERWAERVAGDAHKRGITIHVIGVGSTAGARMRVPASFQKDVGSEFIMSQGAPAITSLEEEPLKELARGSGGTYARARDARDVEDLLHKIAHAEREKTESWGSQSAAQAWVAAAVALLALSLLVRGRSPADAAKEPSEGRLARIERAAARIRLERLLRGEFTPPDVSPAGVDPDDAVPHTKEGWRSIDHRATARAGELFAKRFEEEPEIPVYLLVDLSPSSTLGARREALEDAAGALALAASREEMPVGLIVFSDKVELVVEPGLGAAHARELFRRLAAQPGGGKSTDLGAPLAEAMRRLRSRGLVLVLSDFDAAGHEAALAAVARRHVVVPVLASDPRELDFPDLGPVAVADPETGAATVVDTGAARTRKALRAAAAERDRRSAQALRRAGVRVLRMRAGENALNDLLAQVEKGGEVP
ncbi:MAG TPA: VWA domain-containing protein [Elusimicrobiota bacterium]|nr:VWA domain-containing protein [Elusimicrobiota bacterium]